MRAKPETASAAGAKPRMGGLRALPQENVKMQHHYIYAISWHLGATTLQEKMFIARKIGEGCAPGAPPPWIPAWYGPTLFT